MNENKIDTLTNEEIHNLKETITLGKKISSAYELFLSEYIESRKIQLLQEFIKIDVTDSKGVFNIKYKLDAVIELESNVRYLLNASEAASIQLSMHDESN